MSIRWGCLFWLDVLERYQITVVNFSETDLHVLVFTGLAPLVVKVDLSLFQFLIIFMILL